MMSKKVPELRFAGFADDWEERKVKDIFKITRGKVLAATEISEEKSDISPFPVYSSQTKNNGLMGYYKEYLFDTAITWTTDGANAGTVSYRSGRFYSTNVNGVLISDKGYANKAISEILNLEAWKWVSHVGNPKLMNNVMGDISIMIPSSFEEQDRLSDFLNQLDNTIALHQRKLDLLKEQKKGFLQKMFPKNGAKVPELRFAGFADDWEERKLSDIVSRLSKSSNNSELPRVEFEDIVSGEGRLNKDVSHKFDDRKGILFSSQNILYGKLRPYLKNWLLADFKGIALGDFWVFKSINSDPKFVYSLIQSNHYQKVANDTSGTKMPRSDWKKVSSTEFQIPSSLEEQKKIGSFFKKLDDTIALHQRKLDLLKEQKKGFLQKMFV
ncbi:restriction endonuclease subunit S [Streptococcus thermophilus]|nr:restriction endonuclease subunit S [Streptococcus thermophilus]